MKIIATADTHGALPDVPKCDIFLHAGDFMSLDAQGDQTLERDWFRCEFVPWLSHQPAKHVIYVGGNHDFFIDKPWPVTDTEWYHVHYLQDEGILLEGIFIYGTPWTPNLPGWAFQAEGDEAYNKFMKMPPNVDILLSHGPPYGTGDHVNGAGNYGDKNVGSRPLLKAIMEKQPKVVVCGHIHEGYGYYDREYLKLYNVSHCTDRYEPINALVEVDVPKRV